MLLWTSNSKSGIFPKIYPSVHQNVPQCQPKCTPVSATGTPLYPTQGINVPQCLIQGYIRHWGTLLSKQHIVQCNILEVMQLQGSAMRSRASQAGLCTAAKTADFAKKCRPVSRYVNIVIVTIIIITITRSKSTFGRRTWIRWIGRAKTLHRQIYLFLYRYWAAKDYSSKRCMVVWKKWENRDCSVNEKQIFV